MPNYAYYINYMLRSLVTYTHHRKRHHVHVSDDWTFVLEWYEGGGFSTVERSEMTCR